MALVTVTVTKPSPDAKIGIRLAAATDDHHKPCLVVSYLAEDSLFAGTDLATFYQVVSINGTDISDMLPTPAVSLLKQAESEIVVVARIPHSLVTVTATKSSVDSPVGITLTKEPFEEAPIVISKLEDDSIFAGTTLKPGYTLLSVNGTDVVGQTATAAITLIKQAEGALTLRTRTSFGSSVSATATKAAPDMALGLALRGVPGHVYIKDFTNDSPFRGLLPIGPVYQFAKINGIPVKTMKPSDIGTLLGLIKEGPVTIELVTALPGAQLTPPGLPNGGEWGELKTVKSVYRVNGKVCLLFVLDAVCCTMLSSALFSPSFFLFDTQIQMVAVRRKWL